LITTYDILTNIWYIKLAVFPQVEKFINFSKSIKWLLGSFQVTHISTTRYVTHNFVLVFYCNYVSVLYYLGDIITYLPKFNEVTWLWPLCQPVANTWFYGFRWKHNLMTSVLPETEGRPKTYKWSWRGGHSQVCLVYQTQKRNRTRHLVILNRPCVNGSAAKLHVNRRQLERFERDKMTSRVIRGHWFLRHFIDHTQSPVLLSVYWDSFFQDWWYQKTRNFTVERRLCDDRLSRMNTVRPRDIRTDRRNYRTLHSCA